MVFEIFKGKDDEFYFSLVHTDGSNLLKSEGYKAKDSCKNGIESVKKNIIVSERIERKETKDNRVFFNINATNGQTVATSRFFTTEEELNQGLKAMIGGVADAAIKERG